MDQTKTASVVRKLCAWSYLRKKSKIFCELPAAVSKTCVRHVGHAQTVTKSETRKVSICKGNLLAVSPAVFTKLVIWSGSFLPS